MVSVSGAWSQCSSNICSAAFHVCLCDKNGNMVVAYPYLRVQIRDILYRVFERLFLPAFKLVNFKNRASTCKHIGD
jgi:hypothetical protein